MFEISPPVRTAPLPDIFACAGEDAAKRLGAPPLPVMRFVSTSGTMEELISKLLVLIGAETRRFGNNVRPVRIFTDCSTAETGAFCQVYNHMTTEAFCNLRVRQVLCGQPCQNPVDGLPLTELVWCHSHVQHAKYEFPLKKLKKKMPNALKGLLARFLVAIGHRLTHVTDFLRLVQWLKVSISVGVQPP